MSANNGNLMERLGFIVNSNRILILCELKEILKQTGMLLLFRKEHLQKCRRHIVTVYRSNPAGFYIVYLKLKKKIRPFLNI